MTPARRLAAIALAGLVPWIVVWSAGPGSSTSLVFSFGLVNPAPLHVTPVTAYVLALTRGLPESLLAWPIASLLYAAALVSAWSGWLAGREDPRLTGGLLGLAGLSLVPVAAAVGRPAAVVSLPVGTATLWLVDWWGYRDALADIARGASGSAGR